MANLKALIIALENAPDELGIIKISTDVRDIIVNELKNADKGLLIIRPKKWIRIVEIQELADSIEDQINSGKRVISIPNCLDVIYTPKNTEIQVLNEMEHI